MIGARRLYQTACKSQVQVLGRTYEVDSMSNISNSIAEKLNRKLLNETLSPLSLLCRRIQGHFEQAHPGQFEFIQDDNPVVRVTQNFDELLIPPSHPSRSPHDSYYINREFMLRTHMTANEREIMASGVRSFLLVGDVYRRDEIDTSHLPVFHQLEGARIFTPDELLKMERPLGKLNSHMEAELGKQALQIDHDPRLVRIVIQNLYETLEGFMRSLFGRSSQIRWQETYFPFTQPSFEAEVYFNDKWLEIFGSGVLQKQVIHDSIDKSNLGWAFGMGLERVAMVLHQIPDIRLFWTTDPRFHDQFRSQLTNLDQPIIFSPFSKYPPIYRDLSFYHDSSFQPNEIFELIRNVDANVIENVQLLDEYTNPKTNQMSKCYRITYRSMECTLTDSHVNEIHSSIRQASQSLLNLQLR